MVSLLQRDVSVYSKLVVFSSPEIILHCVEEELWRATWFAALEVCVFSFQHWANAEEFYIKKNHHQNIRACHIGYPNLTLWSSCVLKLWSQLVWKSRTIYLAYVGDLTALKSEFKMFLDWFLIPSNAGTLLVMLLFTFMSFSYVIMCVLLSVLIIFFDGLCFECSQQIQIYWLFFFSSRVSWKKKSGSLKGK